MTPEDYTLSPFDRRLVGRTPSPDEQRWAMVHIMADKRKPLPEWWGKRR